MPEHHPVSIFYAFWREAAAGKPVAPWARFDAADHPKILPWVILIKREDCDTGAEGFDLRYAVCGTGCTELFGASYEGKLFGTDMSPEDVARRRAEIDDVMSGSGPLFSETDIPFPNRDYMRIFRGVFPFSTDGRTVDRIMVIVADVEREV